MFAIIGYKRHKQWQINPTPTNEKCKHLISSIINAAANSTEYSGAMVLNLIY